jgi:hypothetical protein
MDWLVSLMEENSAVQGLVKTGILLGAVLMIRIYGLRKVRQSEGLTNELRRRSIIQIRRASWFLLLFGSLFIWGPKFQGLAVSLLAFAVAIVLAFKELILCVLGAMLKTSARSFTIGDRIEINDLRGDVFDHTLLTTTLLEVGPGKATHQHTGRKIVIPNSLFLNTPVMNDRPLEGSAHPPASGSHRGMLRVHRRSAISHGKTRSQGRHSEPFGRTAYHDPVAGTGSNRFGDSYSSSRPEARSSGTGDPKPLLQRHRPGAQSEHADVPWTGVTGFAN